MRNSIVILAFLLSIAIMQSQQNDPLVAEGDVLTLSQPSGSDYQHIDFPKKNIIIKRGAIPNFNGLIGEKLIVEEIETDKSGKTIAVLRRKDGRNFFRFYPRVKADIAKALANGEVRRRG